MFEREIEEDKIQDEILMEHPIIKRDQVVNVLKKLRNKKAAGPDNLKPEFYKGLSNQQWNVPKYNGKMYVKWSRQYRKTNRVKNFKN